jgi:hypothetical protein
MVKKHTRIRNLVVEGGPARDAGEEERPARE